MGGSWVWRIDGRVCGGDLWVMGESGVVDRWVDGRVDR